MIAWSFRRLRFEMFAVALALVGVGVLALVTGRAMHDSYVSSGLADCLTGSDRGRCEVLTDRFGDKFASLQVLIVPLVLMPGLFGALVGAPLVARDVEAGTHRFLWTQSITRRRWLAWSAGAAIVIAAVSGALFAAITAVWLDVTNRVTDQRFGRLYDFQGIVPVAATVMAGALGVLAGAGLRRTVPAMAATFGAFVAVRLGLGLVVRPRLIKPVTTQMPFTSDEPFAGTGAWILSNTTLDATGKVLGTNGSLDLRGLAGRCPSLPLQSSSGGLPSPTAVDACLRELNVQSLVRYQPGSRYWTFQMIESLIMMGIAAAALGAAFGVVRRRIT